MRGHKHHGGHEPGEHLHDRSPDHRHHPHKAGHLHFDHPHTRHHRPHPHRPRHGLHRQLAFVRHIEEIVAMGASEADVHDVIDHHLAEVAGGDRDLIARDPGRGTEASPISAVDRAVAIADACHDAEDTWLASLHSKRVLVAGEFPPHMIEGLLADGVDVTQIHPPHDGRFGPAHFHHLGPLGLRGLTSLHELAQVQVDVVLVHGASDGNGVYVSPLVPIVLRMYPDAERHLLLDDHVAPHMIAGIAHDGFTNISTAL